MTTAPSRSATETDELLRHLMAFDSRNPDLAPESPGERPLAEEVAVLLRERGLRTELHDAVGNRPNVVGVLPGTPGQPTVLFEAHLDTVPTPTGGIPVREEGRRLFGRGTCDTKGSLAAMIAAAGRLAELSGPRPTLVVAGVADEEYVMRGAAALPSQIPPVDGVVIGEPTSLAPVRAHNGFIRVRVQVGGRTAHSSKAHLGVNAIVHAARVVTALDDRLGERLRGRPHALTGPALLSPTMVSGGVAPNIVPDRCEVMFDRRLAPDESAAVALAEIDEVLDRLRADGVVVRLDEPIVALPGMETGQELPIVRAAEQAVADTLGRPVPAHGVTYSTDACFLSGTAGLPCVVLGPGSIDQAHTDDEWVDLDEVATAVDVYVALALSLAAHLSASNGAAR
jgi:acetylornithine deacetylase/succinyl-diaminopimelate desuccinylase-like protein